MPPRLHRLVDSVLALALGLAALGLYLSSLAHGHLGDPVAYAEEVALGMWFQPRHLLHNMLAAGGGGLLTRVDPAWTGMAGLQRMSAGIGAAGVAAFFGLLRGLGIGRGLAVALAAGLAVLNGWWSLAVTYEVHLLPAVLMLGVLAWSSRTAPQRRPTVDGAVLGGLHGVAILVHQTMVLAGPAVLLAALLRPGRGRRALAYLGTGATVVLVGYLLTFLAPERQLYLGERTVVGFIAGDALAGHPGFSGARPWHDLAMGLREVIAPARLGPCVSWELRDRVRPGIAVPGATMLLVLGGLAAVGVLAGLPAALRARPRLFTAVLGWWAVVLPVVAWWEPGNFEYFLAPGLGLLLLWGAAAEHTARRFGWSARAALIALILGGAGAAGWTTWTLAISPAHAQDLPHHRCEPAGPPTPQLGPVTPDEVRERARPRPRGRSR